MPGKPSSDSFSPTELVSPDELDDGGVSGTIPLTGLLWSSSGPGVTSASFPTEGLIQFAYDNTPSSYNWETWTFSATAAKAGSVAFDWDYYRHHSWYNSYARAKAYADGRSGRTGVTLYDGSGGVRTDTGSATLELYEGYAVGFQVKGMHYDSSKIMRGTLSVMTEPGVSVTVNNPIPTMSNVSVTPEIGEGGSAELTGRVAPPVPSRAAGPARSSARRSKGRSRETNTSTFTIVSR